MNGLTSYKLTNDIDFANEYFFPLTHVAYLDGNGVTIKNIQLEWDEDNVGLCDCPFHISNLTLENVTFKGRNYVGGFSGGKENAPYIENCKLIGKSEISGTGDYVGGFLGKGATFANVSIDEECIVSGVNYVGGIVGQNWIDSKMSNVSIGADCTVSGVNCVGGIVGVIEGDNYFSTNFSSSHKLFDNCITSATVTATGDYVGGIFGRIGGNESWGSSTNISFSADEYTYSIQKCENHGSVTGRSNVGGIGGEFACYAESTMKDRVFISQSVSDGTVTGETSVGGILGATWASVNTCYTTNDITGRNYAGGIIGSVSIGDVLTSACIRNCYSLSNVTVSDTGAGGIVGSATWKGPHMGSSTSVVNCYYSGTATSGIVGESGGECHVYNCLTTSSSLGENLGDHEFAGTNYPDVVTNSQAGVTSILKNIDVINGDNAYSTEVWQGYNFDCVKFASDFNLGDTSIGGVDSPDFDPEVIN